MRPGGRSRGFSLVELMIALVVSTVVIAGALSLLTSQQRTFQRSAADRAVQETARMALEELTSNLRLAGYGIDPAFAFDFGPIAAVPQDRLPAGQVASVAGYACATPVACRDSPAGPPDEIVFHYRDPAFFRALAAAPTTTGLSIDGPLPAGLRQGQILQVMCFSGRMLWAYVTVGADVPATTSTATVSVPLAASSGNTFGLQNAVLADSCFQTVAPPGSPPATVAASAKVYKVERFRYFVQTYDPAGNVVPWGTAGARPYLMLDQGLRDASGAPILQMVTPDVEDLQLSYIFPRAPAGQQTAGDAVGTPLANSATSIDLGATPPPYADPAGAVTRTTHSPANILAVRVEVVVRNPDPDIRLSSDQDRTLPAAANRDTLLGPAGYRRASFETTEATPNLDVRAPYFPSYSTSSTDRLNVGGG